MLKSNKLKKKSPPKKRGNPGKFEADMVDRIKFLIGKGFDDKEVATAIGVTVTSLTNWKKKNPELIAAIEDWKKKADREIEASLREKAKGFIGPDGKYYPPSDSAQQFWLRNRNRKEWSDTQKIEVEGSIADALAAGRKRLKK